MIGKRAESAFADHGSELFEREHNVDVFASICEVVCEVRRSEFGGVYIGGDCAVCGVVFEVEGCLT